MRQLKYFLCAGLMLAAGLSATGAEKNDTGSFNIGNLALDHVNIAVKDLEKTRDFFRDKLGFTIKKGRRHDNSIMNHHIKFGDGTALELITASEPLDSLARWYTDFIKSFPGGAGAFLCLRLETKKEYGALMKTLRRRSFQYKELNSGYADILSFAETSPLHPLFFVRYKRPVKDPAALLRHANTAQSLHAVWLNVTDNPALKINLLKLYGKQPVPLVLPPPVKKAAALKLKKGFIYLVEGDFKNKRIVGATVTVRDLRTVKKLLEKNPTVPVSYVESNGSKSILVPPDSGSGVWLEFTTQRVVPHEKAPPAARGSFEKPPLDPTKLFPN